MITIVRGNEKIVCSEKTFKEQYEQLGYLPISEIASNKEKEATQKVASSLKAKKVVEEDDEKNKISEKYGLKSSRKSTKKEDK